MRKLSMIGQMKKEAERDFTKFVKYVAELEEENRKLREENTRLQSQKDNSDEIIWNLIKENEYLESELEGKNDIIKQLKNSYENMAKGKTKDKRIEFLIKENNDLRDTNGEQYSFIRKLLSEVKDLKEQLGKFVMNKA